MIQLNGRTINFNKFPNGETYADIRVQEVKISGENRIYFKFAEDADITHLVYLKQFVDEYSTATTDCILVMPYVPYSRMDRHEQDRLFTLKYFANIINSLHFTRVFIMEPHSEVTPALLNCVDVWDMSATLAELAMRDTLGLKGECWFGASSGFDTFDRDGLYARAKEEGIFLVYPDAGAEKRYVKQLHYENVMSCSKERDFNTGAIKSIELHGYEKAKDCKVAIIVDDLCSKGGTFIGTAKQLREKCPNLKKVILCITHCENTIYEGTVLSGNDIDVVYTTDSSISEKPYTEEVNFDRNKLIIREIRREHA